LLPLFGGICVRERRPALADKLKRPADRVSAALNFCVLGFIVVAHFQTLMAIRAKAFVGMLGLVVASMATGWLIGETGSENRKTMGFSTSVRNVAVGLVIATASFPGTPAVMAVLAFGLFQTIVLALVALTLGQLTGAARTMQV